MKKFLIFGIAFVGITISCQTFCHALDLDYTLGLSNDSKQITISTTPSSPTHVLTKESFTQKTYLTFNSTYTFFISSVSTNLNFNTSPAIYPASTSTLISTYWSPDGINNPYAGDLWVVASTGTTLPSISVHKFK